MKILGIEASGQVASVAILTDDLITAEYTINHKITHSQTLLPMIDEVCTRTETDISEIDAIAVSGGPGSFTGLRIGSATAKGLGFALNVPLIHVPSLDAMAYNVYGTDMLICPIMDARRNQTYTCVCHFEEGTLISDIDGSAIAISELIDRLNTINKRTLFIGDGIPVFREAIDNAATFMHEYAPAGINRQKASSVALLGKIMYEKGMTENADSHLPDYYRVSQAERERAERLAENE